MQLYGHKKTIYIPTKISDQLSYISSSHHAAVMQKWEAYRRMDAPKS